ncbi:MAG: glutathione transferase GstA [Tolumonas sp.]|uniref:glutathione transferase GstA n=1 Tax=uncultured Tolumonas sp. TaxID=263765 RepID=UPI002A0A14DB|nr:glutathione transferase GstA [uncultured Tolumonas sp.]MDD2343741.1 glutathione transferase GstA [Tolumonas sp.]MDD2842223.1 glutathione transferase GstA [Tolumonas sp.]
MKLYYAPGACSQASHIALRESGLDFQLEKVDLRQKITASGEDYRTINPLGYVPALQLDTGDVITEGPAIMQFIADQAPAAGLLPVVGVARYRAIGWLNFIATELHKTCSPLFSPTITEEQRKPIIERLSLRLDTIEQKFAAGGYLMGVNYCVADIYLFVVTGWFGRLQIPLKKWPHIERFREVVATRPAVQAALEAEGLI